MKHPGRKFLSLLLALVFTLALVPTAFADQSTTTTGGSASKDQSARTEMYVATQASNADYPSFGAKNEPTGTYYGRIVLGGPTGNGWGPINMGGAGDESIVGFYYTTGDMNDGTSLETYSYLFRDSLADGKRAFLLNFNFVYENDDCAKIVSGGYDSKLREMFTYLNTISNPVFVRIGGEQNIWDNKTTGDQYIPAYQHVAQIARSCAPRAAMVFSINYMGHANIDSDSYYPGDEYVDWVGTTLYFDHYHESGDTKHDKFYGVGDYGDPMLNVQQAVNLAGLHNKPLMITEGGSATTHKGADESAFAAERMQRAMSFLPMVYPQIKAIVMSDYDHSGGQHGYLFYNNSTVTNAYLQSVKANPALIHSVQEQGACYTKVSSYTGAWAGSMQLAAYTYATTRQTATWSVDGQTMATTSDYPYAFNLDVSSLSSGKHTLKVAFSNGATKSFDFWSQGGSGGSTAPSTAPSGSGVNANPTDDMLYVNGQLQTPTVYKINDNNYFKIRDVAMLLNGTPKQFEILYDAPTGIVQLVPGQPYTANGSELAGQATGGSKAASISTNEIYMNGQKLDVTAYQIDGSNYFKLRDLGQALDFYVGWDPSTGMSISGSAGYQN